MSTMITVTKQQQARRMRADREELADRIGRSMRRDEPREVQPGLFFHRLSAAGQPVYALAEPCLCVIAQGAKEVMLGDERFRYDPSNYLISTMHLPITGQVVEATSRQPYLSLRLNLDPALISTVLLEAGVAESSNGVSKGLDVSPLDADLLDATLRLVRLAAKPNEYRVLAPLVTREIIYRLATGAQASRLRHLAHFGGRSQQMTRAVESLRENYDKPLRVEDAAREIGMSVSSFHSHFKAATAMSPLQFQKELRLQEARRLMLGEALDAAEAGYRVGYEDPSYFSRDYKRHFGQPPLRDIARLRETAAAAT